MCRIRIDAHDCPLEPGFLASCLRIQPHPDPVTDMNDLFHADVTTRAATMA